MPNKCWTVHCFGVNTCMHLMEHDTQATLINLLFVELTGYTCTTTGTYFNHIYGYIHDFSSVSGADTRVAATSSENTVRIYTRHTLGYLGSISGRTCIQCSELPSITFLSSSHPIWCIRPLINFHHCFSPFCLMCNTTINAHVFCMLFNENARG